MRPGMVTKGPSWGLLARVKPEVQNWFLSRVQRPRGRKPRVFIPALLLQSNETQVQLHQLHRRGQVIILAFYWSILFNTYLTFTYLLSWPFILACHWTILLNTLFSLVREILGTAQSVGCTIEGETPQEWLEKIADGDFECPEE